MTDIIAFHSMKSSATYCTCCFIFHYVTSFVSPRVINGFYKLTKEDRYGWYNRCVSIVHASFVFCLTIYYWTIYQYPHFHVTDVSPEAKNLQSLTLDIMMGYLWYDIIVELVQTQEMDTLGHHILGLISHLSCRLSNNQAGAFYSMMVYIAEGSTPFLHTSWLLHKLQLKNTKRFKFCVLSLLVTFFICRVVAGPFMLFHMTYNSPSWGPNTDILFAMNYLIVFLFVVLNFYWFYKLITLATK